MALSQFNGQLRSNEIFTSIFNMIISQQVQTDNIAGTFSSLLDSARVDGSMFGDTKLFYATDVLATKPWGGDTEAANLLALNRPADPAQQAIYLDQFRMVDTTLDNYMSKRAWMDEGAFGQFQSVSLAWLNDTKRVYESTLYNSYIGTCVTEANKAEIEVDLSSASTAEDEAKFVGQAIADLVIDMTDVSRDFNDYGYLRSYNEGDIKFVTNSKWLNKLQKVSLPAIFHKDGLIDELTKNVLPARYFGDIVTKAGASSDSTRFTVSGNNITVNAGVTDVRSMIETDYTVAGKKYHVFPGDIIPAGATFTETVVIPLPKKVGAADSSYPVVPVAYIENADIICKVMVGNAVPVMSGFETATSFYNPRSLTENHYLIFAHNTLQHRYDLPLITLKKA